jgi:ubiquinone/menaquinone biosynthesis C-methylase UbiE
MSRKKQQDFAYESIEPGYYDAIFYKGRGIQSQWHRFKFAKIKDHLPSNAQNILDVGCGPGTFIGNFLPPSIKGFGIDIANPQIEFAKKKYPFSHLRFIGIEGDTLPFEDGFFDSVTCIELIEHLPIEKIDSLLKEIKRVLRPGGALLLTTPNYGSAWPLIEFFVNKLSPVSYAHQHISKFRKKSLINLLRTHGFNATVESYMGVAPFSAVISNKFSEKVLKFEKKFEHLYGMLLFAQAYKV